MSMFVSYPRTSETKKIGHHTLHGRKTSSQSQTGCLGPNWSDYALNLSKEVVHLKLNLELFFFWGGYGWIHQDINKHSKPQMPLNQVLVEESTQILKPSYRGSKLNDQLARVKPLKSTSLALDFFAPLGTSRCSLTF